MRESNPGRFRKNGNGDIASQRDFNTWLRSTSWTPEEFANLPPRRQRALILRAEMSMRVVKDNDANGHRVVSSRLRRNGVIPTKNSTIEQGVDGTLKYVGPRPAHKPNSVIYVKGESLADREIPRKPLKMPRKFPLSTDTNHRHHFRLEEQGGSRSTGYCKHCGETREFRNASDIDFNSWHD